MTEHEVLWRVGQASCVYVMDDAGRTIVATDPEDDSIAFIQIAPA